MPQQLLEEVLNRREAAAFLRVSVRTLDMLLAEREIIPARVGRKRVVVRREALLAYLRRQERRARQA